MEPSPPTGYYQHVRQEMLAFLPATVGRMLDVGCAQGAFAAACRERYGCVAWGIEGDADAAAVAATRLDHVLVGDIPTHLAALPAAGFDLIVCNDVLEHLAEPDAALRQLRLALAPGGCVVASIPNIRYHRALATILFDAEFPRHDDGIFDRTHLRFFTRNTIARMFDECGFDVRRLEGINASRDRSFLRLNRLLFNKLDDCRYLQFACVAVSRA